MRAWPALDERVYVVWAVTVIAYVASVYVSAMFAQTGGAWSAPLDDVFIHFDYARSAARGAPFEWHKGNGYSSGGTSATYPLVLALGWALGFRDTLLMAWAIAIACGSLLVFLVACARYSQPIGSWAKYLAPPALLSLGVLDWSLFSGMENAFHLGVWGVCSLAWWRFCATVQAGTRARGAAVRLALALTVLVLTRPESLVCALVFAVAASRSARKSGFLPALGLFALVAGLPALALAGQAVANRAFTGEWSQAGAIAKLAIFDPYATTADIQAEWVANLKHVLGRMTWHHFADRKPFGLIVPALALVPLFSRKTREPALMLWAQIAGWLVLVSFNGQVLWQNERYVMSAVAWLLLLAATGVALLASQIGATTRQRLLWGGRLALAGLAVALYWHHQRPNLRDQVWFFARACRNIRDQQLSAGRALAELEPRRILVGDAGAIIYAADRPGLDIIGLGGYHAYPFARALRHGMGATLELIERLPEAQRPDYMAIYPSWWGDLPIVFGHYVGEITVVGNVICGAPSKVIYRTDWSPLDRSTQPRSLGADDSVLAELDVADLISEGERHYLRPQPNLGPVVWRVLGDPLDKNRDLFDAGRVIAEGQRESFDIRLPAEGGKLFVRTVATQAARVTLLVAGAEVGVLDIRATGGWVEPFVELPAGLPATARVELVATEGDWVDHHVWVAAKIRAPD